MLLFSATDENVLLTSGVVKCLRLKSVLTAKGHAGHGLSPLPRNKGPEAAEAGKSARRRQDARTASLPPSRDAARTPGDLAVAPWPLSAASQVSESSLSCCLRGLSFQQREGKKNSKRSIKSLGEKWVRGQKGGL